MFILACCITDIRRWMAANTLKLNDTKTDVIVLASPHYTESTRAITVTVGNASIASSQHIRNLGVIFDQTMSMQNHVSSVCQSAFFHLRNIRTLKPFLTTDTLTTVAHAFLSSRIDYCNSILIGIPDRCVGQLQRIQNCTARLIANTKKYDHIRPILIRLHWLPVKQRILFKLLLITYKAVHGEAPSYICELLTLHTPNRSLRSSGQLLLHQPRSRLKHYEDAAFSVTAPSVWNSLPINIRSAATISTFKSLVQTHLFNIAFSDVQ